MAHADIPPHRQPRRRIGCLILPRNHAGDVLLVKPSYRQGWQPIGGAARQDETPYQAARREALEETGLPWTPGALLLIDYTPATPRSVEGYNFVFDGGIVGEDIDITLPAIRPGDMQPELLDWAFISRAQLADYCNEHQTRRIEAAFTVLADPTKPRNLVEGRPAAEAAA